MTEINIAYNVDCMAYMKTLPDKYFDLACVDPPYGDAGDIQEFREQGVHFHYRGRNKKYLQNVHVERENEQTASLPRRGQMEQIPSYNRFGSNGSVFERYKRSTTPP